MKKRNPFVVFLLVVITVSIYYVVWFDYTARDMKKRGADIPSTWILFIPVLYLWVMWRWSVEANKTTKKLNPFAIFLIMHFLWLIGPSIMQHYFNSVDDIVTDASTPTVPSVNSVGNNSYPPQTQNVSSSPEAQIAPPASPQTSSAPVESDNSQTPA